MYTVLKFNVFEIIAMTEPSDIQFEAVFPLPHIISMHFLSIKAASLTHKSAKT